MSFYALPTELDNRILTFLDHNALNAMSRVSKTYRGVAEPLLYRHIELLTRNHVSIRWLVVTLLYRRELATHIRTVKLIQKERTGEEGSERSIESAELLEKAVDKLLTITSSALGSGSATVKTRVSWLGAILADDHVEGSLTMITYLATAMESLTILGDIRPMNTQWYGGELLTSVIQKAFYLSHESLTLDTPIPYPEDSWQPIVDALVENCHKLEYLKLTIYEDFSLRSVQETLRNLSYLRSLTELWIDVDLLVDRHDIHGLLKAEKLLPTSLKAVTVSGVSLDELVELIEPILGTTNQDHKHPDLDSLYRLASISSLQKFAFMSNFGLLDHCEQKLVGKLLSQIAAVLWTEEKIDFRAYKQADNTIGSDAEARLFADHYGWYYEESSSELSDSE